MRALVLSAAAATFIASAASAQIANTGTATPNSHGSPTDPSWTFTCSVLVSGMAACNAPGAAFIPLDIPSPPWQPDNPTSSPNWISAWMDASSSTGTGNNVPNYEYDFSTSVGSAGAYTLTLGWDNQLVGVYQDGNLLFGPSTKSGFCRDADGVLPGSDYPNCLVQVTLNLATTDDLVIKLTGDGTTDGLWVGASPAGTLTPEPASMALMATGLVSLMGVTARRRRKV